jgi:DNA-binding CsgD family transcriptional regulator
MARSHYATGSKRKLTPRQREVLALVAAGKTNREIGDALGMTLDGAKFHVSEIIAKLGVASREEAAEWWRATSGPGTSISQFFRAVTTLQALKWCSAALAAGAVLAAWGALGARGEPQEERQYQGWVQGMETADGLELRGAGWPMDIELAVRAPQIVLGTVESIGPGQRGAEPFWIYRVATVRVDEVIAAKGDPLAGTIKVLVPGGRVVGVDTAIFDIGPDFITGDKVLLYLEPANFEWLEPGVWRTSLDQRIYSTPLNAATPQSLPLDTVIKAIRERRD